MKWIAAALPFLLAIVSAHAVSFDRAKAQTKVEKFICSDPELSGLDDNLSEVYRRALEQDDDKRTLIERQRAWLNEVRNACLDTDCLTTAYRQRIGVLAAAKQKPVAAKVNWGYRNAAEKNEPLCQNLLERLNKYDWSGSLDNRCSWDVIAGYPGFSRPPWQDLDPKQYIGLLTKLEKYWQVGPDGYFHRLAGLKDKQPDYVYAKWAREFIKYGGRLQVWRTTLSPFNGYVPNSKGNSVISGERTLVRLSGGLPTIPSSGKTANVCGGINAMPHGAIFYVTPDLSGPDPAVEAGTYGLISGSDLMIFEGHPIFVGFQTILRDSQYGLISYCDFELENGNK